MTNARREQLIIESTQLRIIRSYLREVQEFSDEDIVSAVKRLVQENKDMSKYLSEE